MSEIIKPYNTDVYTLDSLLYDKKIILKDNNNFRWYASIFPSSTIKPEVNFLYRKDRIITTIDDSIFTDMGFVILSKEKQVIIEDNKRLLIKCKTYGSYSDTIKRYTNLNKPTNVNEDSQSFLNLPKLRVNINKTDVSQENLTFKMQEDLSDFKPKVKSDLFEDNINHPFINKVKLQKKSFKFNSKDYIVEVLKWAKNKGIKYIYCINEHRPYIQNYNYVSPYVYYTIKGF